MSTKACKQPDGSPCTINKYKIRTPNAQLISHRHQNINVYLLQPLLDVIQHVHRDGSDHGDLLGVILEDEDHVEVLQLELDALEVDQLDRA